MALPLWVEFFDYLENVKGRSRNTILAYRRDLDLFNKFLEGSTAVKKFYPYMKSLKLSHRSQARTISSLRTYYRFCAKSGMSSQALLELPLPKLKINPPKPLVQKDFEELLKNASEGEDSLKTFRNQLTLQILRQTGCRVTELIHLNIEDFSEALDSLQIIGRGIKHRQLDIPKTLSHDIKIYLKEVHPKLQRSENSLIINDRGHRPSRVDIWRWLAAWSKASGFEKVIHPHQFRHAHAVDLIQMGKNFEELRQRLGHAHLRSVHVYASWVPPLSG